MGPNVSSNRLQYIATHECMHIKQANEFGGYWGAIDHFGSLNALEVDADKRTYAVLGYHAGYYWQG